MNSLEQLANTSAAQASEASAARSNAALADDFDTFLQLLTTQLQNQDPLEPLNTNEFTSQLVQFSSVEQQIQTNDYLESLITSTEAQAVNAVMNYLGATVTAEGVTNNLVNGSAEWTIRADRPAEASRLTIFDVNGREVFNQTLAFEAGETRFTWDGSTNSGQQAADGIYQIRVEGFNASGDIVDINTAISGRVTGVDVTGSQPLLKLGSVEVQLASILGVEAPSP